MAGGMVEKRGLGEWEGDRLGSLGIRAAIDRVSGNLRGFGIKVPKSEGIGVSESWAWHEDSCDVPMGRQWVPYPGKRNLDLALSVLGMPEGKLRVSERIMWFDSPMLLFLLSFQNPPK